MSIKNGIILTGGSGTRVAPLNLITNKQLLPINGKFIIDYPLQTLKNMGVENLTVILGGNHFEQIVAYLKDGEDWGFNINYVYQKTPNGIAAAVNLCKKQVYDYEDFVVCLGDNIFEKPIEWKNCRTGFSWDQKIKCQIVLDSDKRNKQEIKRFGVATVDNNWKITKLEEKPKFLDEKLSNYPITGCYLFDSQYFDLFKQIKPSHRGEYEILDIIRLYHQQDQLGQVWHEDGLWSDAGTHESIAYVNNYFYNKIQIHPILNIK